MFFFKKFLSFFSIIVTSKMNAFAQIGFGKDAVVYQSPDPKIALKKGDGFSVNLREFTFGVLANLLLPKNTPKNHEFYSHEDGDNVISMERIDGPTGVFIHHDVASVASVLTIYYCLMKKNVFQNDLKATNCIFNPNGIYLLDFGIASTSSQETQSEHMVSMASLFIQSILFPADDSSTWFSRQSSISLRTRYVIWIIGGTARWLRQLLGVDFLQLHVNLKNENIDITKVVSSLNGFNSGRLISSLPPPLIRGRATNSSKFCRSIFEKKSEKKIGLSRRVCFQ